VHREVGDRVAFVGVDGMDSRRNAVEMLERTGARWPSAYDPQDRVFRAYRLRGRPVTVFLDSRGRVVRRHSGQLDADELRDLLREAYGDDIVGPT
jgi:hypothetical protein